jgi:hypothetical protein
MEVFYQGWSVVKQFLDADARVPREAHLPRPPERQVARYLEERREFLVLEVIEALRPLAQPELIQTQQQDANLVSRREANLTAETGAVVAPMPQAVR